MAVPPALIPRPLLEGPGSGGAHPGDGPVHRCLPAALRQRPQWPFREHDLSHQGGGGVRARLSAQRLMPDPVRGFRVNRPPSPPSRELNVQLEINFQH